MLTALFIVVWAACAIGAYGFTLGAFTYRFPYMRHAAFSVIYGSLFGPVALIFSVLLGGGHFRLVPLDTEQRWEIFRKDFSILGRDYFNARHG